MGKVEILADITKTMEIEHSQVTGHSTQVCNLPVALENVSQKEVALEIEDFHNDEDVDFRISSKREMLSILQGIANQGTRVCIYYGSDQHFIITTLLGANEHGMWLNIGLLSPENKQILLSDRITFVCAHQHLKIQFVARSFFERNKAFYIELPDYLLRIQRREFFRSTVSPSDFVKCIIPVQPKNPGEQKIMRAAPLLNISGGGIQLQCEEHEDTLLPNETFPGCQISLPDVGTLTVTIEVRNSISFTTRNKVHKHVGCRFIHLDNQINILLQRHINRLQGESIARRRQFPRTSCDAR